MGTDLKLVVSGWRLAVGRFALRPLRLISLRPLHSWRPWRKNHRLHRNPQKTRKLFSLRLCVILGALGVKGNWLM
ncbi:MAG: hypothetical protein D6694_11670 [Gammaproteobacteria bacterium]|nr:MAG: hypothetical protein D6694_11670 [Gammaproteobacteria bacterium]